MWQYIGIAKLKVPRFVAREGSLLGARGDGRVYGPGDVVGEVYHLAGRKVTGAVELKEVVVLGFLGNFIFVPLTNIESRNGVALHVNVLVVVTDGGQSIAEQSFIVGTQISTVTHTRFEENGSYSVESTTRDGDEILREEMITATISDTSALPNGLDPAIAGPFVGAAGLLLLGISGLIDIGRIVLDKEDRSIAPLQI